MHRRGGENIAKRYLIHTTAFNLGLIMRKLIGLQSAAEVGAG